MVDIGNNFIQLILLSPLVWGHHAKTYLFIAYNFKIKHLFIKVKQEIFRKSTTKYNIFCGSSNKRFFPFIFLATKDEKLLNLSS